MPTEHTSPNDIGGLFRGEQAADHFTIISNLALRDPRMSWRARGVFANLASHRGGFRITEEFLASHSSDGVKTVRAALAELRQLGYVYRGARMRYPAGTRNANGKDISGALGPYQWYVTDKPEEVAQVLERYAAEQRAALTDDTAGQHYVPDGEVVPTSDDAAASAPPAEPVDNSALGAQRAASDEQGKHHKTAGHHNRPYSAALKGRTKEDHHQKNNQEHQTPPAPSAAPEPLPLDVPAAGSPTGSQHAEGVEASPTDDHTLPSEDREADFDAFWDAYPRKTGKKDARRKWETAIKREGATSAQLLTAAQRFAALCRANRTETRFIPHPATWLHQGRYEDAELAHAPAVTSPQQPSPRGATHSHQPYTDSDETAGQAKVRAWLERQGITPDQIAAAKAQAGTPHHHMTGKEHAQ